MKFVAFTLRLLVSHAGNFCKQFGPRSGMTKCHAQSGTKLFDTQMVFLKEFSQIDFEKKNSVNHKKAKLPRRQRLKKSWVINYQMTQIPRLI